MRKSRGPAAARGGGGREWAESTIEFKLYKFIYRTDTENKTSDPTPVKQTNIPRTREFIFFGSPREIL